MSASGSENPSPAKPDQGKQVSASDACVAFFQKVLRGEIGEPGEDNSKPDGAAFYKLILKLQAGGNKDAVKIPLRVLRDEISRAYFSSAQKNKSKNLETLFQLYESLEATCQEEIKSAPEKAAVPTSVLLALRDRLTRLVIGETWEAFPELKTQALKQLYKLAVKENLARKALDGSNPAGSASKRPGMLARAMSMKTTSDSLWADTINDLGKAPASKLLPLIKTLLAQSVPMPAAASVPSSEEVSPRERSVGELETQASDASSLSAVNSRMATVNMDDLLGLNDSVPATPTAEPPTAADDPFQVLAANGNRGPSTPTQTARQNGQAAYDTFGANKIAAVHTQSNGFGRASSGHSPDENTAPGGGAPLHMRTASNMSNVSSVSLESKPSDPRLLSFPEPSAFSKQPSMTLTPSGSAPRGGLASGLSQALSAQPSGTLFGAAQQDAFNPFNLPTTPSSSQPPPFLDNRFADVSPVTYAPPPAPVPKPMRAPPPAPAAGPAQPLTPTSYGHGASMYQSSW